MKFGMKEVCSDDTRFNASGQTASQHKSPCVKHLTTPEGGPFLSSDIRCNKIPETAKDVGIAWKQAAMMAFLGSVPSSPLLSTGEPTGPFPPAAES